MLTRRSAVLGVVAAGCAHGALETDAPVRIRAIETRLGARIGVAALNTATGDWIKTRAQERFAMASTFKWLLAAQTLDLDAHMPGYLDRHIEFTEADLLEYAPVSRSNLARGWMTVEELCAAAVTMSDNTAANLLLDGAGGPAGFTSFLRTNGDSFTRLDRIEPDLNENAENDVRDTTTPEAMARDVQRILLTEHVLNPAARERLIGWMVDCRTGLNRLRAGFPDTWRVGDKTGTGRRGAANDVAIAWPPGRSPIIVACYMTGGEADWAPRAAAHAEIGRIVAETWG